MAEGSSCNAVLIRSIEQVSASQDIRLAALHIINRASFERLKRDADAGMSIPIVGDIVGGSASYDEFREHRDRESSLASQNQSEAFSLSVIRSYVPSQAIEAWRDCMRMFYRNSIGLHAIEQHVDDDSVTVEYSWTSPPGQAQAISVQSATVSGARAKDPQIQEGEALPHGYKFVTNGQYGVYYERIKGKDFDVTINADGYSTSLSIPRYVPPKKREDRHVPQVGQAYRISAKHSGLRLDVCGANRDEGGRVCQAISNSTDAQIWQITQHPVFHDRFLLMARCSGKVLDVYGGAMESGARVCQATYNGTAAQAWAIERHPTVDGCYLLRVLHSSHCLDVYGANMKDNGDICQAAYNGTLAQAWGFEMV